MTVALLGIPYDASSSFQRGAAAGPAAIRRALRTPSSNTWDESLRDLADPAMLVDAGDASLDESVDPRATIEAAVGRVIERGQRPLVLGGDHSITYPVVRAMRARHSRLTVLHLDAHPDLYDEFDGNRYSHACPFARIMEAGLAERLAQLGIRTLNAHQQGQVERFGVEVVPMREGLDAMLEKARGLAGPLYLSLDLDVLDPAHAPGVSHPEPGGLSTRELVTVIQALPKRALVGADVVELNPAHDLRDLTARVAAKLVKEIGGRLAEW